VHHPRSHRFVPLQFMPLVLLIVVVISVPDPAMAQASPFMTGATALQTNARVAREYLVALPVELSPRERLTLVRGFSQELSDRYGFALDFAIHAPRDFPGSDPRNFHAHLLATTREVTSNGLGAKTTLDLSDKNRFQLGLRSAIHELLHVRERWAAVANEALHDAHIATRIDHRTLAAQGIDREPRPHIPKGAFEMERHGFRSELAERLRGEYEARVEARAQTGVQAGAQADGQARQTKTNELAAGAQPAKPQSLEDIRREARENWLQLRQSRSQGHTESTPPAAVNRGRDDDLAK